MLRYAVPILVSFLLINTSTAYAKSSACTEHQCITVIDAGSTGSRAHIYSYDIDETNTATNITELWNKKISPGFATIDPDTVNAYLDTLLADSPEENIPVFFYATAGMRLLPQYKQKKYYSTLQQWFSTHPQWQLKKAKTITGVEEGLYDWLAVNYHLGTFTSASRPNIGVMDMGGASVQIVLPIESNPTISAQSLVEVELYGQQYTLFIHSFLGLGQTEVTNQFLNSSSCFTNEYPLPDGKTGLGNASNCEQEVSSLINNVHGVSQLIQTLLQINPVDSWYTIGGVAFLAHHPLLHFDEHQFTNQQLLEEGDNQFCHQQWNNLEQQFPDNDYIYKYCLFSAYYYALMVHGYGIDATQTINYIDPEKNVDWTLGVVLHPS